MDQKKIDELQRRLDKLKGKPVSTAPTQHSVEGLGPQFEEMGKSFGEVRKIISERKKNKPQQPSQPIQYAPWAEKVRKIVFYVLAGLIGGGAIILIVIRIIQRFL